MAQATTRTPTRVLYAELERAYDHFNRELFGNELPSGLLTVRRATAGAKWSGYFAAEGFKHGRRGDAVGEVCINAMQAAAGSVAAVLSTLAHEMVHLWQHQFGKPSRGYHNKQWAAKMYAIGLMPSATGKPGGKPTGQRMTHYVIAGGAFERASKALLATGFTLSWHGQVSQSVPAAAKLGRSGERQRYTCRGCQANAWGKAGLNLMCGDCKQSMPSGIDWLRGAGGERS